MLHICEGCEQFIRESICPFCATVQKKAFVNPLKARLGVSRGALLVGGALAIAGCGESTTADADLGVADAGADLSIDDAGSDATATDLGADLGTDLGTDLGVDAGTPADAGMDLSIAPAYGIPPPDAGEVQDAGEPDLSIAPLYGIPPSEPGEE